MLDLQTAEAFISQVRTLRVAGETDKLVDLFDDQGLFWIVGIGEPAIGKQAIRQALEGLVDEFQFLEYRPILIFVHGNHASIRHGIKVRHRPTGTVVGTETSDFVEMKDGRCLSYTQYVDTALIARLRTRH